MEGGVGVKEKKARWDGVSSRTSKRTERREKERGMGEGGLGNKSGKKKKVWQWLVWEKSEWEGVDGGKEGGRRKRGGLRERWDHSSSGSLLSFQVRLLRSPPPSLPLLYSIHLSFPLSFPPLRVQMTLFLFVILVAGFEYRCYSSNVWRSACKNSRGERGRLTERAREWTKRSEREKWKREIRKKERKKAERSNSVMKESAKDREQKDSERKWKKTKQKKERTNKKKEAEQRPKKWLNKTKISKNDQQMTWKCVKKQPSF